MTHFKLYLLTPQFRNNATVFMEDQIAEFYSQLDQTQSYGVRTVDSERHTIEDPDFKYKTVDEQRQDLWDTNHNSFSYSYNEKVTKEQNAQKTLTFEMNRYIMVTNEWKENPFARNLMVGSIILLKEFRYKEVSEETLFTVTSIQYTFKENNTIYNITCQDSFTYQTARLNDGYEITNNPESSDFIGAKTIDWWIINKIMPECHMNYRYLTMQTGLYLTKQGNYYSFDINQRDHLSVPSGEEILKIIKEPYSPNEDTDYFESFSFSCSNSNANAALISLADLINFQLNTFEHGRKQKYITNEAFELEENLETNIYDCFFWVEPKQNDQRLGLEYSPSQSIKSFGLTHKGETLTTILNVKGPTIDEEVITLIPSVPPFFSNLFLSGPLWDQSAFLKGYFNDICHGTLYINYSNATADTLAKIFEISLHTTLGLEDYTDEQIIKEGLFYDLTVNNVGGWFNSTNHYRYFPIYSETPDRSKGVYSNGVLLKNYLFETPFLYDYISFSSDNNNSRIMKNIEENGEITSVTFRNTGSRWELVLHDLDTDQIFYISEDSHFNAWTTHAYRAFIRISMDADIDTENPDESWNNPSIYMHFYRQPTAEDLEFASIADNCPWLENKLMDFSYFYTNRIITENEYQELIRILNDQLRITNGKLLIYSQAYYNALHQETEILAELQNKLDLLGAECQASVINPCASMGSPNADLSEFKKLYLECITNNNNNLTPVLNHTELLEQYFTKYWNAQQRYLKNIKSFRDYFEAPVRFSAEGLYSYDLSINLPDFARILIEQTPIVPAQYSDKLFTAEISFYSFANAKFNVLNNDFKYYTGFGQKYDANSGTVVSDDDLTALNYGEPQVPLYKYIENEGYVRLNVASQRNYKNLYIPNLPAGSEQQCGSTETSGSNDTFYNKNRIYYELMIKIPVSRIDEEHDWYLAGNSTFKVGITTSLTWDKDPLTTPWHGAYRITRYGTNTLYLIAESLVVDNNGINGYLLCSIIPTTNTLVSKSLWQQVDYGDIYLAHYADNSATELTLYSNSVIRVSATTAEFKLITLDKIIDKYIYKQLYLNNTISISSWYTHNHEYYELITQPPLWFYNYGRRGLITTFAKNNDAVVSNEFDQWGHGFDDDALYRRYYPITECYYKGPKYKITSSEDNTYSFYRLNKDGKNQGDYYQSLGNEALVDNPYEYEEYQPIPFVTINNEAEYFRRIHGNIAGQTWSGVGTGISSLALICFASSSTQSRSAIEQYNLLWKQGPTWFARAGVCSGDFFGGSLTTTAAGFIDENKVIYSRSENGYTTYQAFLAAAKDNNGDRDTLNISEWSDSLFQYASTNISKTTLSLTTTSELENPNTNNPLFYGLLGNQIAATFSYAVSKFYYKRSNARFLKSTDRIVRNGKYKIIWWRNSDEENSNLTTANNSYNLYWWDSTTHLVDMVKFYPITNAMMDFDIANLDWSTHSSYTVNEALTASGYHIDEDYSSGQGYCVVSNQNAGTYKTGIISFFAIEDYERRMFSTDRAKWLHQFPINFNSGDQVIYDYKDLEIDFEAIDGLVNGLFYIQAEDAAFQKVSTYNPIPVFDRTVSYYNDNFERIYTIYQLIHEKPFITTYLQCQNYSEELLAHNVTEFSPVLVKNTALISYKRDDVTDPTDPKITYYRLDSFETAEDPNVYHIDFKDSTSLDLQIDDIIFTIFLSKQQISNIKGLTNGAFWYKYHNNLDHPLLLQQAAVIESQLSGYWETAYIASKYCEFFLPEHWQPVYDTKTNTFASKIFTIYAESDNFAMKIAPTLVPEVKMVENEKGETLLPRYVFQRISREPVYMNTTSSGKFIDENKMSDAITALSSNQAVINAFDNINEDLKNWSVEEAGKTTYYYAVNNTGMTWDSFLYNATKLRFNRYSGLYVMLYRLLREQYRELPTTEYQKYQKQHDHLWTVVTQKYPFMVLQNTYTNENATSSEELFNMAKYSFKSLNMPEAEYSISVLNSAELRGLDGRSYYGQEIRIGDGIKLDAQAYYNEYDQIYRSLSQYLFISKISYSLRNPIDVSLTVNDVQYQDKIMQRLVKLIK